MSGKHKIKKIKEYLKSGRPQFDIINRREPGKNVEFDFKSGTSELDFEYRDTLFPPDNAEGIIQIVKRISDDQIFHQTDMVEVDGFGSSFLVEFKEDLVHCVIADIFSQDGSHKKIVEINQLIVAPQSSVGIALDDENEEDLGGEPYYISE